MLNTGYKKIIVFLGAIFLTELLSFAAYSYEPLKIIGFGLLAIIITYLTVKNLENGLLILFVDLIIDSKGHLFDLGPVSLRMLIFSLILFVFLINFRKKEFRLKVIKTIKDFKPSLYLGILAFFVLLATSLAFIYKSGLSNIFSDVNAWLFFLLIFPILFVYQNASNKTWEKLKVVLMAAFFWLCFKTLFILYVFVGNPALSADLYLWLRKTGVAEITPTLGSWPRIFLQSQIYAALALIIVTFNTKINKPLTWVIGILSWSVCLLSMSRSFWLALILVLGLGLLWLLIFINFKEFLKKLLFIILSFIISIFLILGIVYLSAPKAGGLSTESLTDRVNLDSSEAAVASRWSLLPVMWQEIIKKPILGFGYGKTITYKSSDPRVLQNDASGTYTTYAFEWGYLALWLKMGLLGLASYLFLLGAATIEGLKKWYQKDNLAGSISLGIILIGIVNFFTPYLDHPLGIGYLLMALVIIYHKKVDLPETQK